MDKANLVDTEGVLVDTADMGDMVDTTNMEHLAENAARMEWTCRLLRIENTENRGHTGYVGRGEYSG